MASARDSGCITVGQNLRAARRFSGPRPLRPQRMRRAQKRRNLPPLVSLLSAAPNMRAVLVPERGLSGRSTFGVLKRKGILLRSSPLQRAAPKMGAVRSLAAAPRSEAGSSRANSPAVKAGGTPALLRRNRRSHRIHHGFGRLAPGRTKPASFSPCGFRSASSNQTVRSQPFSPAPHDRTIRRAAV